MRARFPILAALAVLWVLASACSGDAKDGNGDDCEMSMIETCHCTCEGWQCVY